MNSTFKCSALTVRQQGAVFYISAVSANDLVAISRPLTRPSETGVVGRSIGEQLPLGNRQLSSLLRSLDSPRFRSDAMELLGEQRDEPYQRFLDEKRSLEIAKYVQQPDALLPNSIILAVSVDLDESDVIIENAGGVFEINLPLMTSSTVILDGQHRIGAIDYLPRNIRDNIQLPVTFLIGIPFYQQAEVFAMINGKQKPVNKSIIFDLFGYAPINDSRDKTLYEGLMAVSRFCSHVARLLNSFDASPWNHKIKMRGPGDFGLISQAAVVEYMSSLVEPKTFSRKIKVLPVLFEYFQKADSPTCAALIILYLSCVRLAQSDNWENPKSLFWKNNGVAVIMRLLHDEILLHGGLDGIFENPQSITDHWKKAPSVELAEPPKTGGGGVQNQVYARLRAAMFTTQEIESIDRGFNTVTDKLVKIGGIIE